jgi:phosphoribosylformylglycinamidine cyclo-ligase
MTLTYRGAGVDADAADRLVERIKPLAARTLRPEVLAGVGGFGALVRVPVDRYREPVLVSGTDGVGTKLRIAFLTGVHDTIGIDLVAMCANDVVTCGAEPLYFLDYFATGKLESGVAEQVIAGIAEGCVRAGCALVGGETAEMPGAYPDGEYDLAGFCTGVVERSRIIDGSKVRPGDRVVGLASNGLHSNGYSLARKVLLEKAALRLDATLPGTGRTVAEELLRPTHVYAKCVLDLQAKVELKAVAHVTGGGLPGNLPRVLPQGTRALVDAARWRIPLIFEAIRRLGPVAPDEMARTFNLGLGLSVVVSQDDVKRAIETAEAHGFEAWDVGGIEAGRGEAEAVVEHVGPAASW